MGSRNTKNTHDFLVQVRNFLLPLSLKVLRLKERDTHSFYSGLFICLHLVRHLPQKHWPSFGVQAKASRLLPRQDSTQLTDFFKIPKILRARASGAWRHSHPLVNLSIGFLFWHQWPTHPPCAFVNTCTQVCTSLTHVLSQKVLSLTKPKGIKRNPTAIILQKCR